MTTILHDILNLLGNLSIQGLFISFTTYLFFHPEKINVILNFFKRKETHSIDSTNDYTSFLLIDKKEASACESLGLAKTVKSKREQLIAFYYSLDGILPLVQISAARKFISVNHLDIFVITALSKKETILFHIKRIFAFITMAPLFIYFTYYSFFMQHSPSNFLVLIAIYLLSLITFGIQIKCISSIINLRRIQKVTLGRILLYKKNNIKHMWN